ncbi:MAG TPA: NAD-dependent malic enzyme, partial [Candidatus Limnocylindrales bacterium]
MRPLPHPFDRMIAGESISVEETGSDLLGRRLFTKDLAFSQGERAELGLRGLLPDRVLSIEEQVALEVEHIRRKDDDLERYIGLAALQDRNATLYYRVLAENLEEFLPIVYTPTVGRACQQFSHIIRRTRGVWITPADVDRVPELLRAAPFRDVRLIVVTDNERILGLGDQGAGGMAIPTGKLALYTAASGIHPAVTLPVSLDVGTDNAALRDDPLYVGYAAPRLRGPEYDALVEAFVQGVGETWPGCLIQWEDFKGPNALRILDRYRHRVPSFNDDIQGTAVVVLATALAGMRHLGRSWPDERIVIAGAGAAGIGIARLLRMAMAQAGVAPEALGRSVVLVDSHGLVHAGRTDLDEAKRDVALAPEAVRAAGLPDQGPTPSQLEAVVTAIRPTILVGATAVAGTFTEAVIRALASDVRPIALPLSNPTSRCEAEPADILRWTDGRALVATGSPFPPVESASGTQEIAQANNVFVFPGLGLGAIVAEARAVTDGMLLAAAHALADSVTDERLAKGTLLPPIGDLRAIARKVAIAVVTEARRAGVAGLADDLDPAAAVDAATWWQAYVP